MAGCSPVAPQAKRMHPFSRYLYGELNLFASQVGRQVGRQVSRMGDGGVSGPSNTSSVTPFCAGEGSILVGQASKNHHNGQGGSPMTKTGLPQSSNVREDLPSSLL